MIKFKQADFGTPAATSADTVKIEIDGLPATVKAVQVAPATHRSDWQHGFDENAKIQGKILEAT